MISTQERMRFYYNIAYYILYHLFIKTFGEVSKIMKKDQDENLDNYSKSNKRKNTRLWINNIFIFQYFDMCFYIFTITRSSIIFRQFKLTILYLIRHFRCFFSQFNQIRVSIHGKLIKFKTSLLSRNSYLILIWYFLSTINSTKKPILFLKEKWREIVSYSCILTKVSRPNN